MANNDHDLLITVSADIKHLVKKIAELDVKVGSLATDIPTLRTQVKDECGKRVGWSQYWGITVLLAGLLAGVISYNFKEDAMAHAVALENKTKIYMLFDKGVSHRVDINPKSD